MSHVMMRDLRFSKHACSKMVTRYFLAMLLCSCHPLSKPESPQAHTSPTQKEPTEVGQQDPTVSVPSQSENVSESLSTTHATACSFHSEQVGVCSGVASGQYQYLDRVIELSSSTVISGDDDASMQCIESSLVPREILATKLDNPQVELTSSQSISLIEYCAQLGEENATHANDKEVTLVLGNTGVGKSTFLNCLMGCEMKLVKPSELNIAGLQPICIVAPGSTCAEITSIGHDGLSKTFMPQIVTDPAYVHRAYCDCPGFLDNRGAEINIVNTINISGVLQQARSVKAVFLVEYSDLTSGRRNLMRAIEGACLQMFGSVDKLSRYQDAVLLGITKALSYEEDEPLTRDIVRSLVTRANTPIAQILADHIFFYDPLDRGRDNPNFWSIERCRAEIAQLSSIPQCEATTLFKTVLTSEGQTKLKQIMRAQASPLASSLACGDYQVAGRYWQSLARLRVVGDAEVEAMLEEHVLSRIREHVLKCVESFRGYALRYHFDQAEEQLSSLRMLTSYFPDADLQISLSELDSLLARCVEEKLGAQRDMDEQLAAVKQEAVRKEMERDIQQTLNQLLSQLEGG
jgi:hypothetical protein